MRRNEKEGKCLYLVVRAHMRVPLEVYVRFEVCEGDDEGRGAGEEDAAWGREEALAGCKLERLSMWACPL